MPGFILHLGATVTCSHGGQATPADPFTRVLVWANQWSRSRRRG